MGCECQQSQSRAFGIGVFISSCVSSPLTLKQKPCCCGWKLSWAGASCPFPLPGGSPILSFTLPALGVTPLWCLMLCRSLPCWRCSVAESVLLKPASAPPQLKAHQQIRLFFPAQLPVCVCKPHSASPNLCVCFPIRVPSLPGREEETPPNPAWAVLLLSSNPPRLIHSPGAPVLLETALMDDLFPSFPQDVCVHPLAHACARVRAHPALPWRWISCWLLMSQGYAPAPSWQ